MVTHAEKDRPEFEALVVHIAAGEITSRQAATLAAEQTESSAGTFLSWLRSSGAASRLKAVRGNAGANHRGSHAKNDPDKDKAYAEALAECRTTKHSIRAVAIRYADRGVSYQWLIQRHNKRQAAEVAAALAAAPKLTIEALERALKTP